MKSTLSSSGRKGGSSIPSLAMGTSGIVTTVSGVVVALVVGGLALGWPAGGGERAAVPMQATAATLPSEFAMAAAPEPVRLAMAEKEKRESES